MPLSNVLMTFISSAVNSKLNRSKFCFRRTSLVLFGMAETPRCNIHFNRIWAGVLPKRSPICLISGISRRSGISRLWNDSRKRQENINENERRKTIDDKNLAGKLAIWQFVYGLEMPTTHSLPESLYRFLIPFEPNGEYAVTVILLRLQYSTSSLCWK